MANSQSQFFPEVFALKPEEDNPGPRLWIRRLVIWDEPDTVLQDIPLHRGLNVVWSPDSRDSSNEAGAIPHGSGKTTFCRLIRYCLGEESFATEEQQRRVQAEYPDGFVGAEIMIGDETWSVIRYFKDCGNCIVARNCESPELALLAISPATGMGALTKEITRVILRDSLKSMPKLGAGGAWRATLAWATRDQECSFAHPLIWRVPVSHSGSPVRTTSAENSHLLYAP